MQRRLWSYLPPVPAMQFVPVKPGHRFLKDPAQQRLVVVESGGALRACPFAGQNEVEREFLNRRLASLRDE